MLEQEYKPRLHFVNYEENISGEIEKDKISVVCVPKNNELIRKFFPHLKEIEYK